MTDKLRKKDILLFRKTLTNYFKDIVQGVQENPHARINYLMFEKDKVVIVLRYVNPHQHLVNQMAFHEVDMLTLAHYSADPKGTIFGQKLRYRQKVEEHKQAMALETNKQWAEYKENRYYKYLELQKEFGQTQMGKTLPIRCELCEHFSKYDPPDPHLCETSVCCHPDFEKYAPEYVHLEHFCEPPEWCPVIREIGPGWRPKEVPDAP